MKKITSKILLGASVSAIVLAATGVSAMAQEAAAEKHHALNLVQQLSVDGSCSSGSRDRRSRSNSWGRRHCAAIQLNFGMSVVPSDHDAFCAQYDDRSLHFVLRRC